MWKTAKQPLAPAAQDAAAPGLSSKVPVRGDRAAKQKAADPKQRDPKEPCDTPGERYLVKATWQVAAEILCCFNKVGGEGTEYEGLREPQSPHKK